MFNKDDIKAANLEQAFVELEKRVSDLEDLKKHAIEVLRYQIINGVSYYELKCLIEKLEDK